MCIGGSAACRRRHPPSTQSTVCASPGNDAWHNDCVRQLFPNYSCKSLRRAFTVPRGVEACLRASKGGTKKRGSSFRRWMQLVRTLLCANQRITTQLPWASSTEAVGAFDRMRCRWSTNTLRAHTTLPGCNAHIFIGEWLRVIVRNFFVRVFTN